MAKKLSTFFLSVSILALLVSFLLLLYEELVPYSVLSDFTAIIIIVFLFLPLSYYSASRIVDTY